MPISKSSLRFPLATGNFLLSPDAISLDYVTTIYGHSVDSLMVLPMV